MKLTLILIIVAPMFQMSFGVRPEGKIGNDMEDHQDNDFVLEGTYTVDALLKAIKNHGNVIEESVHLQRSFKKREEKKGEERREKKVDEKERVDGKEEKEGEEKEGEVKGREEKKGEIKEGGEEKESEEKEGEENGEEGGEEKKEGKKEGEEKEGEKEENPLEREETDIRVMQWNVCSQAIGQYVDKFSKITEEAFSWSHRRYHIVLELVTYMADIITLQEVDHFKFLRVVMKTQNYEGHFYEKRHSMAIWQKINNGYDGLAIFYRKDRFELKSIKHIDLPNKVNENPPNSNQPVSVLLLFDVKNQREICVASTHLKSLRGKPGTEKIRLLQGQVLMKFLKEECGLRPVILTGDFNEGPSGDFYQIYAGKDKELSSAYAVVYGEEPSYTTWSHREIIGEKKETFDYVLYGNKGFSVNKVLTLPDKDAIGEALLPCIGYPSDHMSLVVDFTLN